MLSLLFTICMIWFVGKFFVFGLRASWGIMKLLCTVIFFPVILIGMVVGGLMYIAFPLLIVGGIIALVGSFVVSHGPLQVGLLRVGTAFVSEHNKGSAGYGRYVSAKST